MNRDIAELQMRLSAWLPEGERITGLRPLTAGHTNDTYVIEGLDSILRLPPSPAPWLEAHDIVTQARIYREAGAIEAGPPVPAIHHICEDPQVLGDPFYIMELVQGRALDDYQLPEWFLSLTDEERSQLCGHWVAAVGRIGRMPTLVALGEPLTPEQAMRRWQHIARDHACPELATMIDRLLACPAPRSGPPGPVQGDCKITNMLFDGLEVAAVLDWELGYNGEPLSDLGYLLYFFASEFHGATRPTRVPGMWSREQVIPAWEVAAGRSADGIIWYEAAEMAKMAGIYAQAKTLYSGGGSDDPRLQIMMDKLNESIAVLEAMLPRVAQTCG